MGFDVANPRKTESAAAIREAVVSCDGIELEQACVILNVSVVDGIYVSDVVAGKRKPATHLRIIGGSPRDDLSIGLYCEGKGLVAG